MQEYIITSEIKRIIKELYPGLFYSDGYDVVRVFTRSVNPRTKEVGKYDVVLRYKEKGVHLKAITVITISLPGKELRESRANAMLKSFIEDRLDVL